MFQAVRGFFAALSPPALDERKIRKARRLGGLFLFEFVVVVLGVFVAQMLQENAATARTETDARVAVGRAAGEAANFRATSEYWLRAAPCLETRMDELMRAAANGTPDAISRGPRPRMPLSAFTPWSETTTITARRMYGDQLVSDYAALGTMAAKMAQDSHDLAGEWTLLGLIDPALGDVAREDRFNARLAAGRIKGRLASLNVTALNAVAAAERLGVSADSQRSRLLTLPMGCARVAE